MNFKDLELLLKVNKEHKNQYGKKPISAEEILEELKNGSSKK